LESKNKNSRRPAKIPHTVAATTSEK
jgi:hypothetical protein